MPTCTTSTSSSSMSPMNSSIRWASRGSARSESSALRRPSPMRSTTPPESACATCRSRSINCCDLERARLVLFALPNHDDPHRLVVDVRVQHRRALDIKPVALKTDVAHLFAADPAFVPRRLDLGDDLAAFDAIAAGIGDHGFKRLRAILIRLRDRSAFRGHQCEPAAFRRCDLDATRMLAVNRRAFAGRHVLVDDRHQRPGADDLPPQLGVVHHHHSAVQPPSSPSAEPVISEEASEARKTMAPESSSSWPRRPSFIFDKTSSRNALFSKNGAVIGVSRNVGPRLLTRMLCGASSIAMALVKPSMACLEAQ